MFRIPQGSSNRSGKPRRFESCGSHIFFVFSLAYSQLHFCFTRVRHYLSHAFLVRGCLSITWLFMGPSWRTVPAPKVSGLGSRQHGESLRGKLRSAARNCYTLHFWCPRLLALISYIPKQALSSSRHALMSKSTGLSLGWPMVVIGCPVWMKVERSSGKLGLCRII